MTTHPILGPIAPVESLGRATLEAIESSGGCSIPKVLVDINARALELPAFGQWLPIESAPEDETVLFHGWNSGDPEQGAHIVMGSILQGRCINRDGDEPNRDLGETFQYITHWMPLPPPLPKETP